MWLRRSQPPLWTDKQILHICFIPKLTFRNVRASWNKNLTTTDMMSIFLFWSWVTNIPAAQSYIVHLLAVTILLGLQECCYSQEITSQPRIPGENKYIVYSSHFEVFVRHHDLIDRYEIFISQMTTDNLPLLWIQFCFPFNIYCWLRLVTSFDCCVTYQMLLARPETWSYPRFQRIRVREDLYFCVLFSVLVYFVGFVVAMVGLVCLLR